MTEDTDPLQKPRLEKWEDSYRKRAVEKLTSLIESNREEVFYSRQLEVRHEREFFHWITNAALHEHVIAE